MDWLALIEKLGAYGIVLAVYAHLVVKEIPRKDRMQAKLQIRQAQVYERSAQHMSMAYDKRLQFYQRNVERIIGTQKNIAEQLLALDKKQEQQNQKLDRIQYDMHNLVSNHGDD